MGSRTANQSHVRAAAPTMVARPRFIRYRFSGRYYPHRGASFARMRRIESRPSRHPIADGHVTSRVTDAINRRESIR
jgi:predicted 2-oxoglutarate/Fe(II)-dependent dioxygenase YbiX